jgi:hypothetical protein
MGFHCGHGFLLIRAPEIHFGSYYRDASSVALIYINAAASLRHLHRWQCIEVKL